jgi:DNA-binding Lrp family transcriptional regulator
VADGGLIAESGRDGAAAPNGGGRDSSQASRVSLDSVDLQLIDLLRRDGRMSNRAMSAVVGLKEAAVATRIRALTENQLLAVSTLIDWERAGYGWDFWLHIDVEGRSVEATARDLAKLKTVISVQMVFGTADLILHVLAADKGAVAKFLAEELPRVEGIRATRSSVTLETLKFDVQFATLPFDPTPLELPSPVVEIDEFDEKILLAFMADGRQSNRQVARDLEVSDSTIRLRLGRMEDAGLVRMRAQIDPLRTRLLRAWAYVGISAGGRDKHRICAELATIPEVIVVSLVTGSYDIQVLVAASRRRTLLDIVSKQIRDIAGIHGTEIEEVIETTKFDFRWARFPRTHGEPNPLPR